jgi:probable phosphoglycerate mutase
MLRYGLTNEGFRQVRTYASKLKYAGLLHENVVIIASYMKRTRQTAWTCADVLGTRNVHYHKGLLERGFGELDGKSNENYQLVWNFDVGDWKHKNFGVESVFEVVARLIALIRELESSYHEADIILVSHGDSLQILECLFKGIHPSQHRSLTHLELGELRQLN